MERIIKFRAWDKKRKQMFFFEIDDTIAIGYLKIMQFTGLKDKNGKGNDVYGGDIFEAIFKDCPDGFEIMGKKTIITKINCEVVFKWGKFMIKIMHPELKEYVYEDLFSFLKNDEKVIIGNIHENPELL
jgi:uncharacterized phage protein (TIGR01671 family)